MKKMDRLILERELNEKGIENVKRKIKELGKSRIGESDFGMTYYKVDKYIIKSKFDSQDLSPLALKVKRKILSLENKRPTTYEGRETKEKGFYSYTPPNNRLTNYTRYWFKEGCVMLQTTFDADDKKFVLKSLKRLTMK